MIIEAPVLTDNGWDYVTRAVGGEQMVFTRYKVGNGELTAADGDGHALTNLKNPLLSFGITEIDTEKVGAAEIIGSFSSSDITPPGFYAKELGLFASMGAAVSLTGDGTTKTFNLNSVIEAVSKVTVNNIVKDYTFDEDNHRITFTTAPANGAMIEIVYPVGDEILYAYSNDGDKAGFIGPVDDVVAVQTIDFVVAIGDAEHVTAIISESAVYVSKEDFNAHKNNHNNPHGVTKSDVGLGDVPNIAPEDIALTYTMPSSTTNLVSGEKLPVALGKLRKAVMTLISHIGNHNNPHGVTREDLGAAAVVHRHSVSDFITGVLDMERGGTGASTAAGAREMLGAAAADHTHTPEFSADQTGGYYKSAFGLLVQWGIIDCSETAGSGSFAQIVHFQKPFTSSHSYVALSHPHTSVNDGTHAYASSADACVVFCPTRTDEISWLAIGY